MLKKSFHAALKIITHPILCICHECHRRTIHRLRIIKNDAYVRYEQRCQERKREILSHAELLNFKYVYQINIQINNRCNYSAIHTECPVHTFTTPEVLETDVVHKIIDELSSVGYAGTIMFSLYNEPMNDERFYDFCRYAKAKCPKSTLFLNTNGAYLNETSLRDVEAAGVDCIFISAYSAKEYARFAKLEPNVALCVYPMELDQRMDIYDRDYLRCSKPCHAPFSDMCVNSKGEVVLCCLDWKFNYVFGNVHSTTLQKIVNSKEMTTIFNSLSQGKRELDICKRCDFAR